METKAKVGITAGPWEVDSGMVQTVSGVPIAYMDREPGNGTLPVERDTNAQAIAAVPELIAALLGVLDSSEDGGDMDDIDWKGIRAALAKAGVL